MSGSNFEEELEQHCVDAIKLFDAMSSRVRGNMIRWLILQDIFFLFVAIFGAYLFSLLIEANIWVVFALSLPIYICVGFIQFTLKDCNVPKNDTLVLMSSAVEQYVDTSLKNYKGVVVSAITDLDGLTFGRRNVCIRVCFRGYVYARISEEVYQELSSALSHDSCARIYVPGWKWNDFYVTY